MKNFKQFKEDYLKLDTYSLTAMAMCVALEIVLSRFLSIQTPITRLGFSFIALALAGMLLGPVKAGVVGCVADLIGIFLFSGYTFNPGITLTAILTGVLFGLFLYKRPSVIRCVMAAVLHQVVLSLLLNTLWLALMYGSTYPAMFISRLPQTAIMLPVEIVTLILICNKQTVRIFRREGLTK